MTTNYRVGEVLIAKKNGTLTFHGRSPTRDNKALNLSLVLSAMIYVGQYLNAVRYTKTPNGLPVRRSAKLCHIGKVQIHVCRSGNIENLAVRISELQGLAETIALGRLSFLGLEAEWLQNDVPVQVVGEANDMLLEQRFTEFYTDLLSEAIARGNASAPIERKDVFKYTTSLKITRAQIEEALAVTLDPKTIWELYRNSRPTTAQQTYKCIYAGYVNDEIVCEFSK